jgi:4-aminobutyrate aminotransferase-like enzyme
MQSISHILRCSGCETYKTDVLKVEGCFLEDKNGKQYIDFEAAVWCIPLGYNHSYLNRVVSEFVHKCTLRKIVIVNV